VKSGVRFYRAQQKYAHYWITFKHKEHDKKRNGFDSESEKRKRLLL
jgi:hypothetical protein